MIARALQYFEWSTSVDCFMILSLYMVVVVQIAIASEGYQLTVNSELARFRESDCLIKTKHCDGPNGC